jgi:DNA end-binding protein Ku
MVIITTQELDDLPVPEKRIDVCEFIHLGEVDYTGFGDAYYIEPDKAAQRPYALFRLAMKETGVVAVATFSFKKVDNLGIIRPHEKDPRVLVLQRIAWPGEIRDPAIKGIGEDIAVRDTERELAVNLIRSMTGPWQPGKYQSKYKAARQALIEAKLAGQEPPQAVTAEQAAARDNIGAVLEASLAKVRAAKDGQPVS